MLKKKVLHRSGKSIKFSHLSIQQRIFCIATCPITYSKEWFQDTLGKFTTDLFFGFNFFCHTLVVNR